MRNSIFFSLLVIATLFSSCKDDPGNLDLVFQANFGNDILEFDENYQMIDGTTINLTKSDMFLSDVRLIADDGSEVLLHDIIQVDFSLSPGGVKFRTEDVPLQNYESLKFGIGVSEDINKTKPVDYEASNPLNNSGYYWVAWDSYIFTKTEGKIDDDGDGTPERGWIFHTGKDDLYTEGDVILDYKIEEGENEIRIILDHQPLFVKDGQAVNLGITHDPTDLETLGSFLERMESSLIYKEQ